MKKCPKCAEIYNDDLSFCLQDGTALVLDVSTDIDAETETQIGINFPNESQNPPIQVNLNENQPDNSVVPPTQMFPPTKPTVEQHQPVFQTPQSNVEQKPKSNILTFLLLAALFLALGVIGGGGLVLFMGGFSTDQTVAKEKPAKEKPAEEEKVKVEKPVETPEIVEDEEPTDEDEIDENLDDLAESLDELFETPTPTPIKKACYLSNGSGGEVNVRRNCDSSNCTTNPNTISGTYANRTPIIKLGKSVRSGKFTWIKISINGGTYWVASSKIRCS